MHSKSVLFFVVAFFAAFATANYPPTTTTVTVTAPAATVTTVSQCNTGNISCCNSVQSASNPVTSLLLGLLGIVVEGVDVLIGVTCTPLSVVGIASGTSCTQQPVCCQNDDFNGLVNIGCSPITL